MKFHDLCTQNKLIRMIYQGTKRSLETSGGRSLYMCFAFYSLQIEIPHTGVSYIVLNHMMTTLSVLDLWVQI